MEKEKENQRKRFTIIIPMHDAEEFIVQALESVKSQDFDDYECIVIDDHSQDKSRELVEKYIASNPSINFRLYETPNEKWGPGTVFLRNGKFSMTTHCGALILKKEFDGIIDLEYIYAVLFNKLKQFANGEQNKRVTVNIIKNIYVDIPLDKNNKIDIDKQKEYSKTFNKFKLAKKEVISRLDKLLEINII